MISSAHLPARRRPATGRAIAAVLAGLFAAPLGAQARSEPDTTRTFLYRGVGHGSQATFSPATVLLNVGFEDFLSAGSNRNLRDVPYRCAARAQWDGLRHPLEAVERYGGWRPWLTSEILPLEFSLSAGWLPNYFSHLVGGGLQTRMLTEWYEAHGAPAPKVLGSLTFLAASFLHETVSYPSATEAPPPPSRTCTSSTCPRPSWHISTGLSGFSREHWKPPTGRPCSLWHSRGRD